MSIFYISNNTMCGVLQDKLEDIGQLTLKYIVALMYWELLIVPLYYTHLLYTALRN